MNNFKNLSDEALVLDYQKTQNQVVFGELYQRYHTNVFLYCAKVLKNRDKAADLTQDIFIKVSIKLVQLSDANTFESWLIRIAHNDCMTLFKKAKRERTNSIEEVFHLGADEFDYDAAEAKEVQFSQIEKVLSDLPELEKSLLLDKYLGKKKITELMEKYAMSSSAVKMRLLRSRDKVKTMCLAIH